jgi:folate-binding protein YgfZ
METVTPAAALRPRDYVAVRGPDAAEFLDRMLSNEVAKAPCEALLLTPKARVIAPMTLVRRGEDDYLLLTEPGLGATLQGALLRARFAAKVEIEAEEHTSLVVFGERDGIPNHDYGVPAVELLDADPPSETAADEDLERMRILAVRPRWGREIDDRILPAEAGLDETHISFAPEKGCYPGQEPVARLHYRGKANRELRVLHVEGAPPPETEVFDGEKAVGRITSSVPGLALAYVRTTVPPDAALTVDGATASLR